MKKKAKKKKTKKVDADDQKSFAEKLNKLLPKLIKKQIKKNPGGKVMQ
ncbi:MAG: hypothetical protein IAF38_17785 [Bacteroidia bacterium]|nr:hypothetical protein [Bacteroidia bacterium]